MSSPWRVSCELDVLQSHEVFQIQDMNCISHYQNIAKLLTCSGIINFSLFFFYPQSDFLVIFLPLSLRRRNGKKSFLNSLFMLYSVSQRQNITSWNKHKGFFVTNISIIPSHHWGQLTIIVTPKNITGIWEYV